jgi:hypothetical protein
MTKPEAEKEHHEEHLNTSASTITTNTIMTPEDTPNGVSTKPHEPLKIGLRRRLKHFTFAWFLCTMSTGGLSIALTETPHKFRGVYSSWYIYYNEH